MKVEEGMAGKEDMYICVYREAQGGQRFTGVDIFLRLNIRHDTTFLREILLRRMKHFMSLLALGHGVAVGDQLEVVIKSRTNIMRTQELKNLIKLLLCRVTGCLVFHP